MSVEKHPALESEKAFRLLVESVKDYAIFMLDTKGNVATWNIGAERIKGYRAEEIIGSHFSRFYLIDEVQSGKCEMELEVAAREGRFEDEGWRVRKDGTQFWANVIITALRSEGELVGFAKVTRDLSERRRAEEERLRLGEIARARMNALGELSVRLVDALSVQEVANVVKDRARMTFQADSCSVFLLDERRNVLEIVATRGANSTLVEKLKTIAPDSPIFAVGAGASPAVWIETPEDYEAFLPDVAKMKVDGPRAKSLWYVPLVAEGKAMGLLAVGFNKSRRFSAEEREFIGAFTRQCAQALARARRLEAERAAAHLAERLRASLATTLRSIGDAVIATDATGKITIMNRIAERLTGWSEEEAIGRPLTDVFDIIHEHTRQRVDNPVDKVLQSGGIVGLANHTILVSRDGRELPIDDSGAPIRGPESGQIEGVVLVFRDVTDRKAEEARRTFLTDATTILGESMEYELTVSRVAKLAVPLLADWCAVDLLVDGEGTKRLAVAHIDEAKAPRVLEGTMGIPNVLRTGRSEIFHGIPEGDLGSAMIVPLVARGRILGSITFAARRKYVEDDLGFAEELARRCATAIERARLFSSEQEARKSADIANRAKDEFLAIVSHELRTPLNAIMGWARLLSSPSFDERRRQNAVETIERNAIAMAQLIEDLLDMSRVISGKMRLEIAPVEIGRVAEAALDTIRPAAAAKEITLVPLLDSTLPSLMGDPTRLQQVIWNLLSNAVKFTPKGGTVELVLRRVDSSIEIWVSDTGKGIDPAFLPIVFEPFRQEDASPSRSRGGLGLGLAITRQLVELHGGRISAQSEGEGRGAKFIVRLPISTIARSQTDAPKDARQIRIEGGFEKPAHLQGLNVLVVDDDEDGRRLVATVLEECGCVVRTAESVDDAMQKLSAALPDVLLSDIGMPGRDGYDLIRRVRALPHESGGDVPAAALTAYARPEDRRRMLNAGYSIHLPKPVEPAELVAVVATLSRFVRR